MIDQISDREIVIMGSRGTDKVADLMVEDNWEWPPDLLSKISELRNVPVPNMVNRRDKVVWCGRNGVKQVEKTSVVWQEIRTRNPRVAWFNLVWFSCCIPKHSFILWLAIRRKLMTQDRMQNWQGAGNLRCVLCENQRDSVEHLFF